TRCEQSVSESESASTVEMAAKMLRPSVLVIGRGPGARRVGGSTFCPKPAEDIATTNAMKMSRRPIVQVSQTAVKLYRPCREDNTVRRYRPFPLSWAGVQKCKKLRGWKAKNAAADRCK